uniref:Uncharacterized protein n=1 Tax=Human herpesvirus 2 TaxID=10310 RepID=A0A481TRH8_HHV2|nr:hypothetical protein [Human alphaherpesvirus 2]
MRAFWRPWSARRGRWPSSSRCAWAGTRRRVWS